MNNRFSAFEHFGRLWSIDMVNGPSITGFFDFVTVFEWSYLRAPMELNKKLGHYEYLLLEKR